MTLQLGTVIDAVRGLHPAFDRTRVPDKTFASHLSEYQNTLIGLAVARDKTYLSQSVAVAVTPGVNVAPEGGNFLALTNNEVPFLAERRGYLIQLNGNGVPYLDLAHPISVSVDQGIVLPMLLAVIGGTVRHTDGEDDRLTITSYGRRFNPPDFPAIYFLHQTLFLCGVRADWQGVASIEIRYTPFAPAFAARNEYFLVPDGARQALVTAGAHMAAERCAAFATKGSNPMPDVPSFAARAAAAQDAYLSTLRLSRRARTVTFVEG